MKLAEFIATWKFLLRATSYITVQEWQLIWISPDSQSDCESDQTLTFLLHCLCIALRLSFSQEAGYVRLVTFVFLTLHRRSVSVSCMHAVSG